MICLDSSFLIDFLNNDNGALKVYDKYKNQKLFTTEINIFEISEGLFYSIQKRKDAEKYFDDFFYFIEKIELLPMNNLFAMEAAKINARLKLSGKFIGDKDALIAGIMFANGITKIITKNVKRFSMIKGLEVISY